MAKIWDIKIKSFTLHVSSSVSLNDLLRAELPRFLGLAVSNSKIRRLIVAGCVSVNGRQVRLPAFSVKPSSVVKVQIEEEKLFFEKQPDDIAFELTEKDILFEDESIIVVNKPSHFPTEAGMVGSRDNLHAAIVRFLFERQKIEKPNAKNPPYVGIMHRLDRDTSGVILFTKSRAVNAACHEMFENHTAKKVYNAVVCLPSSKIEAFPERKSFTVDFPLGRISPKGQAAKWGRVSEKDGGLPAKTEFTVLKEISPGKKEKISQSHFLLLECRPLTGRTHQIRVHLASQGLPILGDCLYGGCDYERIMLHAESLTFPHPITGEMMTIGCPSEKVFAQNLEK
ncbi:MAG: RluA family pseudouridine synthase [Treponema sp.]|nr:RluA family pseudouridine synthase [Treponema sp.]